MKKLILLSALSLVSCTNLSTVCSQYYKIGDENYYKAQIDILILNGDARVQSFKFMEKNGKILSNTTKFYIRKIVVSSDDEIGEAFDNLCNRSLISKKDMVVIEDFFCAGEI